jgi:hypothetical protein
MGAMRSAGGAGGSSGAEAAPIADDIPELFGSTPTFASGAGRNMGDG